MENEFRLFKKGSLIYTLIDVKATETGREKSGLYKDIRKEV